MRHNKGITIMNKNITNAVVGTTLMGTILTVGAIGLPVAATVAAVMYRKNSNMGWRTLLGVWGAALALPVAIIASPLAATVGLPVLAMAKVGAIVLAPLTAQLANLADRIS